ncbi:MAG: GNAT family N-acetyltransferase [Clostridiaceae bacterium]|nr:GNAT family N-acetyltransferase [Clostridiaceae bacterium]
MSIIKSHNITLRGGDNMNIVLRPLTDAHFPYLYRWNADPEVLFWTEGGTDNPDLSYSHETVQQIYGGVSQNAFCFIVEFDETIIGECWLQKMNLPHVKAMYDSTLDVRRIDMAIGDKAYWNHGIGTQLIGMLVDFAFNNEHVDVLHCFCEDYNIRSRRVWEKNGFTLVLTENLPQPQKGKFQYHYRLTRQDYSKRRYHKSVFNLRDLAEACCCPPPYELGEELWNDPHISKMMLAAHLSPETDAASYRPQKIQAICDFCHRHSI